MTIDQTLIESAVKLLQAVGLPTVFCGWLMLRVEKRLDKQTTVLEETATAMAAILEHVREAND